jgi:hypothetical protein
MAYPEQKQRKHTEEFYKELERAGIKHVPPPPEGKTHEFGATKHLGGTSSKGKPKKT